MTLLRHRGNFAFLPSLPNDECGKRMGEPLCAHGKRRRRDQALTQPMPEEKEIKRMTDEAMLCSRGGVRQKFV